MVSVTWLTLGGLYFISNSLVCAMLLPSCSGSSASLVEHPQVVELAHYIYRGVIFTCH